ncbi:MAG: glycoside hydrolase family 92 protein [Clostridia bacterium]|nr:glycoside hydrolase family 92 protein [Clostridia bacterium]
MSGRERDKTDYCKYADVFYGNGETDRFFDDGLAGEWVYIKALCGNTTPHATLPFGKMSVGAYSGGYPTGYGSHYPNSNGKIKKLFDKPMARGFSHLHHSGTGAIRYYYNYAVTTTFYDKLGGAFKYRELTNEKAYPGYYSATLGEVFCEITVDGSVALHRYRFGRVGGKVAVDFSNDGLDKIFGKDFYSTAKDASVEIISKSEVLFSGVLSGVRLYFCVSADTSPVKLSLFEGERENDFRKLNIGESEKRFGAVFEFDEREALIRVSYSTVSAETAVASARSSCLAFDEARALAYEIWNEKLSAIKIKTSDEELKKKFYSNLYHSLIKPTDMAGENVLGVNGNTVCDFATLWDQYKTALPLIYALYPEMSEKIVRGIENISDTLGKLPCSFGMSDIYPCEEQAKMLGVITLCDAYHMGVSGIDAKVVEKCVIRELQRDDYKKFLECGRFERYTHILDVTDACLAVAEITDDEDLKQKLLSLAENHTNAYSPDGLMSEESRYYEGDRYTYSFRLANNMNERIALAGGKERFALLLDSFFGFDALLGNGKKAKDGANHRFEGFNNECDMEAPYAYIYADRHDRTAEIIKECVSRSFGEGKCGLPGNNDSGGLSSCFVWNALGIFPHSAGGEFLLGIPLFDEAELLLSSNSRLVIRFDKSGGELPSARLNAELNGEMIENYRIPMKKLMRGGILEFKYVEQ